MLPQSYACTKKTVWPHSEMVNTFKPEREASTETHYDGTLILDFKLQNCEKINVCCWSHLVYGILLRLHKLRQWPTEQKECSQGPREALHRVYYFLPFLDSFSFPSINLIFPITLYFNLHWSFSTLFPLERMHNRKANITHAQMKLCWYHLLGFWKICWYVSLCCLWI